LHLPDSLRVDTGDRQDTTNKDKAALAAADERQTSARAALTQYQLATTPTTGQIATGPVAQNVVYQNSVELNPTVQITVAPGANEHQTIRNVKAATNEAMREQRRAALQTLEDRTGGK
jgi:LmbE family N-acetylglucosaminyl deacetylase